MVDEEAIADLFLDRNRKQLIELLVPIENKDRQVVPFILNPIQDNMLGTSTAKDVYVKPSQVGGTSVIMCDFLLDCLIHKGTTSVIISYDEFITGRLLRKAQAFYDNMKLNIPSIPKLHHRSVYEKTFVFEDRLGAKLGESSFYIASAKGFAMPRGEPIHNLLFDELAFWPTGAALDAFAAAMNRVPLRPGTKVRAVSTPNGEDNDFYDLYMAAKEGKAVGKSVFTAHFYPWFFMPEYSLPADSEFVLPGDGKTMLSDLEPEELMLISKFAELGIELVEAYNKIRWRRYKKAEMGSLKRSGETVLLFSQEFPEDDVSCFQSAHDQWYDSEDINRLAKMCYPALFHLLSADIWYPPEEGLKYLVSLDAGVGKHSESVAQAWTFSETELKHCATMAGYWKDDELAEKTIAFAKYYNEATIANEDALGITSHLVGYSNLYYRTDPVTGLVGKDIGWQTNTATKVFMCNELSRVMPLIVTHDIRIPQQCRNLRRGLSRGRIIPVSVGSDDYHDSAAIAMVCRGSIQIERGFVGAKGWSDSWGK